MSNMRVDQVRTQQVQQSEAPQVEQQQQERIELNQQTTFERSQSSQTVQPDDLAALGLDDAQIGRLFETLNQLTPEQQAALRELGARMAESLQQSGGAQGAPEDGVVQVQSTTSGMDAELEEMLQILAQNDSAPIEDDTALAVSMYVALEGVQGDLRALAEKVNMLNNISSELREVIADFRDQLSNWPDDGSTREFTWTEVSYDAAGNPTITEHTETLTKAEAEAKMEGLEGQLASTRDISDMDRLELQNLMNKQAEIMQTISNIMKNMHDTLKAIISNMRA